MLRDWLVPDSALRWNLLEPIATGDESFVGCWLLPDETGRKRLVSPFGRLLADEPFAQRFMAQYGITVEGIEDMVNHTEPRFPALR